MRFRTVALAGGTPQSFVRDIYGGVSRLGIVEQHLYWAQETRGVQYLARRALSGAGAVERVTADLATNVIPDVVYDSSGIYWSSQDQPTAIRTVPPIGGNERTVFRGEMGKQVRPVSVSDGYVFFTYLQTDAGVPIHKVRVTGEGPSALFATSPYVGFPTIVAERDRLLFFAKAESFYITKTTGQVVRIAQTKDFAKTAVAFTIDDETATWLDGSGRLWKAVR